MTTDGGGWTLVLKGYGASTPDQTSWRAGGDYNFSECQTTAGATSCKLSDARINAIRTSSALGRYRYHATFLNEKGFVGNCPYGTTSDVDANPACRTCSLSPDLSAPIVSNPGAGAHYGLYCSTSSSPTRLFVSNYVGSALRRYIINGNHHSDRSDNFLDVRMWVR